MSIRALDGEDDTLAVWLWMEEFGAVLFYDISNLQDPCLVGSYLDASGFFDLDGRTAYVERKVSDTRSDMVVIPDVTNPADTVVIKELAYQRDVDHDYVRFITTSDMTVSDGIAYTYIFEREGRDNRSRFASLDLRNPESPVWLDELDVYGRPIYIIGDRAYLMRDCDNNSGPPEPEPDSMRDRLSAFTAIRRLQLQAAQHHRLG